MPARKKAVPPHELSTPQLDKLAAARNDGSEQIGAFLDWLLTERGIKLAEHKTDGTFTCEDCGVVPASEVTFDLWFGDDYALWRHKAKHCRRVQDVLAKNRSIPIDKYEGAPVEHVPPGLYPAARASIQELLAAYFEIDEAAAERERRALLAQIRKAR